MTALAERPETAREEAETADARRAAGGDTEAFARLYRAHEARIHSLARRMLGEDDADAGTQDVFVRAWRKLGSFEGRSSFGTWLYRLAINHLLGSRAARGRREARELGDERLLLGAQAPAATFELGMDFESAIARLPEGARKVFVLHDVEGFKHHEIAAMLGVTAGTSKAQLHRARMTLRRYLDR